ncbi:hypothetical protein ACFL20_11075 [Spirochaetota bacterium]
MTNLFDIHDIAIEQIKKRVSLEPVNLKYPFPVRPPRMLGLMKIDGEVYSSEKMSRTVFLKVGFPFYFTVRSMLMRPRLEYDLPVLACEIVRTGKTTMFLVDIHRAAGTNTGQDDSAIQDKLEKIRDKYTELNKYTYRQKGKINEVFERGLCMVKIPIEMHGDAIEIFKEYLDVFLDMTEKAKPLTGDALENAKSKYQEYLDLLVDHDPGVKGFKIIFGAKKGVERTMNIHFEQ